MNSSPSLVRHGLTPESLARAIFKAELPESVVRTLPAQSVYLAVKATGVESAGDLIAMLSPEQHRIALDFELWRKDSFDEEKFWGWLQAIDEEDNLIPLQSLLSVVDLKLISLLIGKYIQTIVFDQPNENPPGPLYFTPDNGFTWVFINIDSPDRHRLMGKLLAFIFESSAELFYQLISIQNVSTMTELEESAYLDKVNRLADEGVPDFELSLKINTPLKIDDLKREQRDSVSSGALEYITVVEPLIHAAEDVDLVLNLSHTLSQNGTDKERDDFEGELSLILNAAIIRFNVDLSEINEVTKIVAQVKGALNIGLEKLKKELSLQPLDSYRSFGLQKIYQLGLEDIITLGKKALRLSTEILDSVVKDAPLFAIIAGARCPFPEYPNFLNDDGTYIEQEGKLINGYRPFSRASEAQLVLEILEKRFSN